MFAAGNPFDVELKVLHGEYHLSPNPTPIMPKTASIDSFAIQFRMKQDAVTGKTILEVTPQSRAFSITIGVFTLLLLWIFILLTLPPLKSVGFLGYPTTAVVYLPS